MKWLVAIGLGVLGVSALFLAHRSARTQTTSSKTRSQEEMPTQPAKISRSTISPTAIRPIVLAPEMAPAGSNAAKSLNAFRTLVTNAHLSSSQEQQLMRILWDCRQNAKATSDANLAAIRSRSEELLDAELARRKAQRLPGQIANTEQHDQAIKEIGADAVMQALMDNASDADRRASQILDARQYAAYKQALARHAEFDSESARAEE
jgi:hypothetical protein